MSLTVQQIFGEALPKLRTQRRISPDMLWAAQCIINCRTEAMGRRRIYCPNGCTQRESYNSCRHRACPQCAPRARDHWLRGWKDRLLDCPHYHIIFTVPQELRVLWRYNKSTFAKCLFAAASKSLLELLADPKYLGARPGILAALHTWSQTLAIHPHLHTIVTAGGLGADGRWKRPPKSCLLPRKVLMMVFRGKLRSLLTEAHKQGDLCTPTGQSDAQLIGLLNRIGRMVLNVKILKQYAHGFGVVTYLARYLHGGPLGNRRLQRAADGKIRFRARRAEADPAERHGEMHLSGQALTARLLEHVAPRRLQTIRGFGLYASHYRSELNVARELCGQLAIRPGQRERLSWQDYCEQAGRGDAVRCQVCNSQLACCEGQSWDRGPPLGAGDWRMLLDEFTRKRRV